LAGKHCAHIEVDDIRAAIEMEGPAREFARGIGS
jgi:hypothetical protein